MPRVVSFIVLLAFSLLIGSLFFRVMMQFVLPLFLAAILVVIFKPVHEYLRRHWPDWPRLVAVATTAVIFLSVFLPLTVLGWNAYRESVLAVERVNRYSDEFREQVVAMLSNGEEAAADPAAEGEPAPPAAVSILKRFEQFYKDQVGKEFQTDEFLAKAVNFVTEKGAALVLGGVQAAFGLILGTVIAIVTVYYFLADGPAMIDALKGLSPLDDLYEQQLLDRFADVSRAVVMATVLSAVTQGLIAGVAYYFVLPDAWPKFLLMALTMVFAVVPFVGCAAVWVPLCIALALFGGTTFEDGQMLLDGDLTAAGGLALFCALIVGNADNIIKPLVLHGQSKLHPLLALLSVIGGVQAMGPIGILVGPMIVSFLQALLAMLNQELHLIGKEGIDLPAGVAESPAPAEQKPPPAPEPTEEGEDGPQETPS